jgi:hypothetical protein
VTDPAAIIPGVPEACQRCRQPVRLHETVYGTVEAFDPEPVPGHEGGAWRLDGERMRRSGPGPRPLHRLHVRSCTEVAMESLIPVDRDYERPTCMATSPATRSGSMTTRKRDATAPAATRLRHVG